MTITTEGIVLRQVKTSTDRRILTLFTKRLGKISAATNNMQRKKGKYSAAINPFTFGKYFLYKGNDIYNINGTDDIKAYYKIGENIDKYACCSYILELSDRILPNEQPAPYMFDLLVDYFEIMEVRNSDFMFLVRSFEIKALIYCGIMPQLKECACCGEKKDTYYFSVADGGLVCANCKDTENLIYNIDSSIINIMNYILEAPLKKLSKLSIDDLSLKKLTVVMKSYLDHHLDMRNMKSVDFLNTFE